MSESDLNLRQVAALAIELESAAKLTDLGVAELHELDLANDYFHLPTQLLSQGVERLPKLTLSMASLSTSGALPSQGQIKKVEP
jgi:hypothetical protein